MADAKVIVIEPSDSEARTLQTLLRFLDLEPVHVHDLAELRHSPHGASQDCLAVIVGKDTVAAVGPELVVQLRSMPQPLSRPKTQTVIPSEARNLLSESALGSVTTKT